MHAVYTWVCRVWYLLGTSRTKVYSWYTLFSYRIFFISLRLFDIDHNYYTNESFQSVYSLGMRIGKVKLSWIQGSCSNNIAHSISSTNRDYTNLFISVRYEKRSKTFSQRRQREQALLYKNHDLLAELLLLPLGPSHKSCYFLHLIGASAPMLVLKQCNEYKVL